MAIKMYVMKQFPILWIVLIVKIERHNISVNVIRKRMKKKKSEN